MRPIFKTEMFIYQSNVNFDEKFFLSNTSHLIDLEIRKMLERGLYGNQDSTFHAGP